MFLENAFIGKTELLRYIGGTFIVIIAYFYRIIPFGVAIVMELGAENVAGMSEMKCFQSRSKHHSFLHSFAICSCFFYAAIGCSLYP